jgi:hypothetical protein
VSLIVTSILVAGGVLVGRWLAKAAEPRAPRSEQQDVPEGKDGDQGEAGTAADAGTGTGAGREKVVRSLDGFPCKLGDVVTCAGGEEAWLAGGLVFLEQVPVSVLFIAPEAGGDRALYARPLPNASLSWLAPVPAGALLVGAEPPTSLEHDGSRFERARRLPVRVERIGSGAPDVGVEVIVGEYVGGSGERLIVVVGAGAARAWRGSLLEDGMYEVLAAGARTLED